MKQQLGRHGLRVSQRDGDGVALVGADAGAVVAEHEALLGAGGDDLVQRFARELPVVGAALREQRVHGDPAGAVEGDADRLGAVSEHEAEELAGRDPLPVVVVGHAAAVLPAKASTINARSRSPSGDNTAPARCATW